MKLASAALTFAAIAMTCSVARALPAGSTIVSKAFPDAQVIWQATPEVAHLVAAKVPSADALLALENDALLIMESKKASIDPRATSVSVKVIYAQTGNLTIVHDAEVFEGFEDLLTIKATSAALDQSESWDKELAAHRLPAGVSVQLTGVLPKY